MFRLSKKLKALKPVSRTLNIEHYSDIQKRATKAREDLLCLQREILISPTEDLLPTEAAQSKILSYLGLKKLILNKNL